MKRKPTTPRSQPAEPPFLIGRSPGLSDEVFEQFMRSVEAFESAPLTTISRLLIRDGIQLPPPESFTEATVHDKLWEVIRAMARHRNFLESTDHLSDLELYAHLWEKTLNNPFEEITSELGDGAWIIDLASDGSEESTAFWLRYYADELTRQDWLEQFPEDKIPERAKPPHDRDRHLPQR
jgi:hypothetical protein